MFSNNSSASNSLQAPLFTVSVLSFIIFINIPKSFDELERLVCQVFDSDVILPVVSRLDEVVSRKFLAGDSSIANESLAEVDWNDGNADVVGYFYVLLQFDISEMKASSNYSDENVTFCL